MSKEIADNKHLQEEPPEDLTREQLLGMYRRMRLIRGFEDRAKRHFEAGEIAGFLHLSQGQEAVPVGVCAALRADDYITSTHRGHHDVIAKGCDVKYMFAELYGRANGYCKGKGGSMHIADFSQGIIGATGIVSGSLPTAPGIALSIKMRGTDQVVVCFFGDGATAEGGFHEALNLSALWQVPIVFVCQNNLYGLSQPWQETAYQCELARRVSTYNIAAQCVDGMDALAVYQAAKQAVERARAGDGPSFIEAKTYRFLGHYVGDPALYMPKEERELWRQRDATLKLGRQLRAWGYLTEDQDAQMADAVAQELDDAIAFAKSSPEPSPEEALTDVYVHFDYLGNPLEDADDGQKAALKQAVQGQRQPTKADAEGWREISYRDALREALREEMLRDERVFLMGEDIADPFGSAYKVTLGLSPEFGTDRVRQTPISELGFVGAGVGAALTGMRPIVELMYIDFSTLPMDQIANQAAKIRYMSGGQAQVPLIIRTQGGMGRSSAAHHAQSLEAWFVHTPGLLVAMPSTPYDAKGLLKTAIRLNDPVIFIEHKLLYNTEGPVPEEEYMIPFGVADVKREGTDCTVVATSRTVLMALQAAEILAQEGISVEVVDPRTLFPLDLETIVASVKKTSRLVVAHESPERGGVAAEMIAQIAEAAFDYIDAPIQRVCAPSVPPPFARHLEEFIIVNETHIADRVRRLVRGEI